MSKFPLVSVAIITYNQRDYLKECIDSILNQTYSNIEIVVADDASSDGTKEMLLEYFAKYPNKFILKLSQINQGITKNSNIAHFACNGKYIAWIGGDDLMYPQKISKQVKYMENNKNCNICYHNLDVFDSASNKTLFLINPPQLQIEGKVDVAIKHGTFNGASSTMVRRDKTPVSGFNISIPIASDWLYWIETLIDGGEIRYIDEILGRYRKHSSNISTITNLDERLKESLITLDIILNKYGVFFENDVVFSKARIYCNSSINYLFKNDIVRFKKYINKSFNLRIIGKKQSFLYLISKFKLSKLLYTYLVLKKKL
jgi:glycosyltransferase involved in cell wall biosynthesis